MFSEVLETYDPAPVVDSTPAGDRRNAKRKEEQAGKLPMPWKQFTGVGGADGVHYFTCVRVSVRRVYSDSDGVSRQGRLVLLSAQRTRQGGEGNLRPQPLSRAPF